MNAKLLKVGILSREEYQKRTISIARGEYRPRKNGPKIWFESLKSMSQVLSADNQALLKLIIEKNPESLAELEKLSHRKKSNLSRTLKTLEKYGIVELPRKDGRLAPRVLATDFRVEFGLNCSE